jgi:outer membrane immunogenic protein
LASGCDRAQPYPAWDQIDTTLVQSDAIGPVFANYGREKDSGFIGGGQAGCDFQVSNLVFGVQGQFDFGNVNGRHFLTDLPTFSETNSLKDIVTGTGRIGYLWTPQFLGYGKVGVAYLRSSNNVYLPGGARALFESASFWQPVLTAGRRRVDVCAELVRVRRVELLLDRG